MSTGEIKQLQLLDGVTVEPASPAPPSSRFEIDDSTNWTGVADTAVTYDVSASLEDARQAVWAIKDVANGYKQMLAVFDHPDPDPETKVRVTASLPAGTYRIVGVV